MKSSITRRSIALALAATLYSFTVLTSASADPLVPRGDAPASNMPPYVVLGTFAKPCITYDKKGRVERLPHPDLCDRPSPITPATADPTSPAVDHDTFVRNYWQYGEEGYASFAASNRLMCDDALAWATGMLNVDSLFGASDEVYKAFIYDVYNNLPDEVRLHTRVMQVTQVVQGVTLCLLSAGLYCIAAAVGAVGNIFTAESSLDLQLANIRLSIANAFVTRLNIWSNRLTLRLDERWVMIVTPFCKAMGIVLPQLPPLPAVPSSIPDELKSMIPTTSTTPPAPLTN